MDLRYPSKGKEELKKNGELGKKITDICTSLYSLQTLFYILPYLFPLGNLTLNSGAIEKGRDKWRWEVNNCWSLKHADKGWPQSMSLTQIPPNFCPPFPQPGTLMITWCSGLNYYVPHALEFFFLIITSLTLEGDPCNKGNQEWEPTNPVLVRSSAPHGWPFLSWLPPSPQCLSPHQVYVSQS